MPVTSLNASDLSELGLTTEADLDAADAAHLDEISANDPFMADLLASMEQAKPTAQDLARAMRQPVEDDGDKPSDGGDVEAAAGDVVDDKSEPLLKPGEKVLTTEVPAAEGVGQEVPAPDAATGAATPTQLSDSFIVDLGAGQFDTIDTDRAKRLLGLEGWVAGLQANQPLLNAMQAVESGAAIPVPADQYQQFQAWLAGGQTGGHAPAATPALGAAPSAATLPPLDEYADDATKALYATVQATQQELQALRQQQVEAARNTASAQLQQHLDARAAVFSEAFTSAATAMGLSDTELNVALNHAAQTRLIQSVNDELAPRHPLNGSPIGEADPAAVARATFERAVYQIPALRDRVIDSQVQARLDSERTAVTSINAKKNRASSLATSPTAAITSTRDPRDMTLQEREAGIARELRAAMSA